MSFSARDLFEVLYTSHCGYRRTLILKEQTHLLCSDDHEDNILDLTPHPIDAIEGIKFENQVVKQIVKIAKDLEIETKPRKISQEEFEKEKVPSADGLYITQVEIEVEISQLYQPLHLKGDLLISKGGCWHVFEIKAYWASRSSMTKIMIAEAIFQGSLYLLGLRQGGFCVGEKVNIITRDINAKPIIAPFDEEIDEIVMRSKSIVQSYDGKEKTFILDRCIASCPNFYRCLAEQKPQKQAEVEMSL